MDGTRFDELARRLAGRGDRAITRRAVFGAAAGLLAAVVARNGADAQVTQAQCGNRQCKNDPGACNPGCVCCAYRNSRGAITNSRCRPPGTCGPGEVICPAERPILDPVRGCVGCRSAGDCPQPAPDSCQVATCTDGVCGAELIADDTACGTGQICCGGACVPSTATSTCGTCANACSGSTPVCAPNGTCVACVSSADCTRGNLCETGTCTNNVCSYTALAENAFCGPANRCCGGACVSVRTNANCGTCGKVCPSGSSCSSIGSCAV